MNYIVDADMKSICDEIASLNYSSIEWENHHKRTFWRALCVGWYTKHYPVGGGFHFSVRGNHDLRRDLRPLTLEEVIDVSSGRVVENEFVPEYRTHPEEMGASRVETDPEVLFSAINDAINVYIREILIPRGYINKDANFDDPDLIVQKHRIARHWAESWKVSWKNDKLPNSGSQT